MPGWAIGERLADGRWLAPSAERNKEPILAVLRRVLPSRGAVLEIASGTGQHVVHFAKALPGLEWQPSDADDAYRESVARWIAHEAVANVRPPIALDVHRRPWPIAAVDAIVCINMIHVAPWSATLALFDGAAGVTPPEAIVYLYGPYRRDGAHTAPSNERFDASLRAHDARWGVRDVDEVAKTADAAGFACDEIVDMPANNLSLVFRKRAR